MTYRSILQEYKPLLDRANNTSERLHLIREQFERNKKFFSTRRVTFFCAGSIARQDSGKKSDLDLFVIADEGIKLLDTYHFFSQLININQVLGYPEFSNDGEFLKVYQLNDLMLDFTRYRRHTSASSL